MNNISARDAKYGFGRLIDLAQAAPVAVAKHGRPAVVVLAIEEFERLKAFERSQGIVAVPASTELGNKAQ
ncbi:MAG: type II toxin-antitoxin system Phd/YefM family antitoxin [Hyphomicrobiaceae bacterium]